MKEESYIRNVKERWQWSLISQKSVLYSVEALKHRSQEKEK